MKIGDEVAIYAAIVGTGSLCWQAFTWWRAGPMLFLSVMANAVMIGSDYDEEERFVAVTVSNRGDRASTITALCILVYENWFARLRDKTTKSFYIPNPQAIGSPPNLPRTIAPGEQWQGIAYRRGDLVEVLNSGKAYVAVYASHARRPSTARIKPVKPVG